MRLDEQYIWEGIVSVVANLEAKLYDAKEKQPKKDFKEQERILAILSDVKNYVVLNLTEKDIIYERLQKEANKRSKYEELYSKLLTDYNKLKTENENLKNNIL